MNNERQIKFKYVFSENYNPIYCNGAYGGVNANGEIIANFYLERIPIPNSVVHTVNPDGSLSQPIETDPDNLSDTIIRHVSTGIVLNENSARAIHEWLGNQLQELDGRKTLQCNDTTEKE